MCSTGNYIQYSVMNHRRKEYKKSKKKNSPNFKKRERISCYKHKYRFLKNEIQKNTLGIKKSMSM